MGHKVRLNLQLSEELNRQLDELAMNSATTKSDVVRRAIALLKTAEKGVKDGKHLGFSAKAEKLDQEIVGLI